VAGTLRAALGTVLRLPEPPTLTVAGRTDAGVHARGQVCHLDVPEVTRGALAGRSTRTPEHALRDRLTGVLPPDVVVREVRVVPDVFDARFAATGRAYRYRVADTAHRPDPLRRDVAWHPRHLDERAMHEAAQTLVGERDFAAFCRPRPGSSTVRTLTRLHCARAQPGLVTVDAQADAFCHHQVRALVGALLAVGEGRRAVGWPAQVLAAGVRDGAVAVAPATGLTLEWVDYPPDDQLVAQVARTRRRREQA
jgi:tRNA pseudouridine38-40 synthase